MRKPIAILLLPIFFLACFEIRTNYDYEEGIIEEEPVVVAIPVCKEDSLLLVLEEQKKVIDSLRILASFHNHVHEEDTLGPNRVALDSLTKIQYENDWRPFTDIGGFYDKFFEGKEDYISDGFDFAVGKPDGNGYYVARRFMQDNHLGDDFNARTGGNTDEGDPVYSIANGFVSFAFDLKGGWGKTVRIIHKTIDGEYLESLYSHCDEIFVDFGQYVKRGDLIGTIGTAHGKYPAHLHLELRTEVNLPLGTGYALHPDGYTSPTLYIRNNRPRW